MLDSVTNYVMKTTLNAIIQYSLLKQKQSLRREYEVSQFERIPIILLHLLASFHSLDDGRSKSVMV